LKNKRAGNSTLHYLRHIHNLRLTTGLALEPVMAEAIWPKSKARKFEVITEEEHRKIVEHEGNTERRLYYEMLWETGGLQTDIVTLLTSRIDQKERLG
jgi:hypothetical protein